MEQRYFAKRYSKSKDLWGIWDRESEGTSKYVQNIDGTRWTSSSVGALFCAEKWNKHGRQEWEGKQR